MDIHNILVPTDFSEPSAHALEYAIEMARHFGGRVHVLHVIEDYMMPNPMPGARPGEMPELEFLVRSAKTKMKRLTHDTPDVEFVGETRIGFPAEMTLEYAEQHDIDLIVMATAGRKGMNRFMLGSVTETVTRRARCPVVSLRHEALQERRKTGVSYALENRPDSPGLSESHI